MQPETVFESPRDENVTEEIRLDETIVFLELTFHNTSDLMLASRIEQSGQNAFVSEEIRRWAAGHGGACETREDDFHESTTFEINGLSASSDALTREEKDSMVARVLDYWLDQYRAHGQSVFRERLVIDVPFERVSGRSTGSARQIPDLGPNTN